MQKFENEVLRIFNPYQIKERGRNKGKKKITEGRICGA
jgi:hypothetical protein